MATESNAPCESEVCWETFLSQHDLHLNELPTSWKDAPHFGNAMLGSMLYMKDNRLVLEVFRADVCDHRDETYGWTAYSRPHLGIGYFTLETAGTPTGCSLRQNLWNAELAGTITTEEGTLSIHHFVHADDMAIVTELTVSAGEILPTWSWHPYPATTARPGYPENEPSLKEFARKYGDHYEETLKPLTPNPAGRLEIRGGVRVWIQDLIAGGQYATAWSSRIEDGTQRTTISIAHSHPESSAADEASHTVEASAGRPRGEWIELHRKWWHAYYPLSYVELPAKDIESLYWQTIYRYACCSRGGRYYIDTGGLWYQPSPWPYSTHDWNTQSAHWGVYAANRLDQGVEIVNRLHAAQETLVANVLPEEWRQDSAFLHITTAADMIGSRRSDRRYHDYLGGLPWLLHNAWMQYRYSMDESILRDTLYPLLKRSMNLYFHGMWEDDDGRLHLQPTYSPETGVFDDANFDLSLCKWGCLILQRICRRLGIDDPLIPRWQEAVDRLIDFPVDERGYMLGSKATAPHYHRHLSHLLMIYPLFLSNIDQPGTAGLLHTSYRLAHGEPGEVEGEAVEVAAMVQTHAGPIGAALGDGDRVLVGLRRLQNQLEPNGLWGCGGNPCIESALGLATIVQDMLLQSWSDPARDACGPIRVFPALPTEWLDGIIEFHDLRTEGAFLVSARREGGATQWIRIKSLAGEPCRIKTDMNDPVCDSTGAGIRITKGSDGILTVDMQSGAEVMLISKPR